MAALPFLGAGCLLALRGVDRNGQMAVALASTLGALALLLIHAPPVLDGGTSAFSVPWVPSLGLELSFRLDGLGLLFAGLILGIGALILVYARFYMPAQEPIGYFLSLLLLFQGAMLGIAVSSNVLLLLIFWELTSLSSFLLIGYRSDKADGRQGARMALAITGGGGVALIGGLLLLGDIAGSYELADILTSGDVVRASSLYPVALVLILLGCFTKSAQFPFHFWLPHAMAAPTPVSAYLHSATMVKAGVFLLARLWPVLSGTELWFYLVAGTGLLTALIGAVIALFRYDLKAILAYSTISHLGLLTMLFGFGTPAAVAVGVFHLLNHAIFKAALFMNAGIVDHEAGTRDVRLLGGLAGLMPVTATLGTIAAASMGGLPPLGGFLSKEMMLEEAVHTTWAGWLWPVPLVAFLAATFSIAYSLRFIFHVYLSARRDSYPAAPHDPSLGMWAPSAILVVLTVLIGLFPAPLTSFIVVPAIGAASGDIATSFHPKLWHGITPALIMSIVAILVGAIALWRHAILQRLWDRLGVPEAKRIFDRGLEPLVDGARSLSGVIHNGSLQRQLGLLFLVAIALGFEAIRLGGYATGGRETIPAPASAVAAWILLLAGIVAVVKAQRQRYLTLIYISIIGLVVSLAFIYLSAPDLALTQISVEVMTILLLLLALNMLPKTPRRLSSTPRRVRDGLLGLAGGGATGWAAWAIMTRAPNDPISSYHWERSYAGGGGTNVVNVTLVDFRGFDTFGEITVLGIAALIIFALLQPATRGPSGQRLREWVAELPHSPERHPMMFAVAARLLLPLAMMVGLYIFLRGHNMPGGGFIAGLIVSIALLMQYMASGFEWADQRRRIDEHSIIGFGVITAALTGLGSLVFGAPLFTSAFGYFSLPLIGKFELTTAMLFDIGVATTVFGAMMLALAELSHIAQRAHKEEPVDDNPMDIDPGRMLEADR
ncbi:monovalent cation/H+ antiporter subunit A [Novosphingobium sp. M1R2S20]|uniref:Monovalent cation/H+ antiporter subunit A n=1 Tax=Novosphingobium rhizovicinum TaxID=3228928 RepID=A0ABV3RFJ3_9SPHN